MQACALRDQLSLSMLIDVIRVLNTCQPLNGAALNTWLAKVMPKGVAAAVLPSDCVALAAVLAAAPSRIDPANLRHVTQRFLGLVNSPSDRDRQVDQSTPIGTSPPHPTATAKSQPRADRTPAPPSPPHNT